MWSRERAPRQGRIPGRIGQNTESVGTEYRGCGARYTEAMWTEYGALWRTEHGSWWTERVAVEDVAHRRGRQGVVPI